MHIHRIRYIGIGPFTDDAFEFDAPGLNVIAGDNETGKSTLCRAMSAVLYGFPDKSTSDAYRSWLSTDKYVGEVDVTGRRDRYRIERDFATDRVRVIKILPGSEKEVFKGDGNPRGRTEPALAYKKLLSDEIGLPSEIVFNSSARVGQLQLEIEIDEDLRKQLSGAGQADYKRARENLREQYYELTTRPLQGDAPKRKERRVESTRSALATLATNLAKANSDRSTMADLLKQKSALQTQLETLQEEHRQVQDRLESLRAYDLLAKRLADVNGQETLTSANDKELAKQDAQITAIGQELADERFASLCGLANDDLEQLRRYLQSEANAALAKIEELSKREAQLHKELKEPFAASSEASPETGQLLESMIAHRETIARLEREIAAAGPGMKEPRPGKRLPLVLLAVGCLLGALIGALVGTALGRAAGMVFGVLGGAVGLGLLGGALGLIITSTQGATATSARAEQSAKQARLVEERNGLDQVRARLAPTVAASEAEFTAPVLLERWRNAQAIQSELRTLANQRVVHESLSVLPMRNDPKIGPIILSQPFEVLKDRLGKYDELRARVAAHTQTRASLQTVAGSVDSERQTFTNERNRILQEILYWEERYPTFKLLRDDPQVRLARLEQDKQALASADAAQKACQQRLQVLELSLGRAENNLEQNPVALQEEIDQRQAELNWMTMRCDALQVSVEVLEQAITDYEKDHLSRLSQHTAHYFSQFTGGRYTEVNIRPDQPIMVTPSAGTAFTSTGLSTGARDQLYFALRLAVSDLLAADIELPLILDDTFVNFDRKRLAIARQMLTQIAATRQVMLLSHDTTYKEWASRVIELGVAESTPDTP
jgi:uncharacterized protein YhaN